MDVCMHTSQQMFYHAFRFPFTAHFVYLWVRHICQSFLPKPKAGLIALLPSLFSLWQPHEAGQRVWIAQSPSMSFCGLTSTPAAWLLFKSHTFDNIVAAFLFCDEVDGLWEIPPPHLLENLKGLLCNLLQRTGSYMEWKGAFKSPCPFPCITGKIFLSLANLFTSVLSRLPSYFKGRNDGDTLLLAWRRLWF